MDDLVKWLGEQLDEDERVATAASVRSSEWIVNGAWSLEGEQHTVVGDEDAFCHSYNAAHIAAHDPARVLREIDAKRQLLDWYEQRATIDSRGEDPDDYENVTGSTLETVMQTLAAVYADRPGYREEWRP